MKLKGFSKDERSALAEFAARLRDRFPLDIEAVRLYGSKARGTAGKESDVDVLILVRERTSEIDDATIAIVCDILDEFGVFIETVTMTTSSYRGAVAGEYPFALNVERESVRL